MDRRERRIRRLFIHATSLFGATVVMLMVMIAAAGWLVVLSVDEQGEGRGSTSTGSNLRRRALPFRPLGSQTSLGGGREALPGDLPGAGGWAARNRRMRKP
ncbi:MAG: hypothetical protein JSU06_16555 [Actinobacteria bacterium]|nr:hypothetical protein [Actinomycetota bacterium]